MRTKRAPAPSWRHLPVLALAALFSAGALAPPALRAQAEPSPYHLADYELEVEVVPDIHQLRGRARFQVVANEPLASVILRLNQNLKVERVVGAQGKRLNFEQTPSAETVRVDLAKPLSAGGSAALQVDYVGAFDPALKPDTAPMLAAIAPGQSYLLPPADWFPRTVNVWERFGLRLGVTLPEGEVAIASGRRESASAPSPGKTHSVFRAAAAAPMGTLAVGRYEEVSPPAGAPLTFYLHSVPTSYAAANAKKLSDIIAFFSDKFGPLKDPGLAIVEVADDSWEAYAAPGLLLLPTRQWSESISERLLARSVARQWWAKRVSPASQSDAWLAEGLARYAEALYLEHAGGEEALRRVLEDLTISALVDESAAPIANAHRLAPFSSEYDSVVRDKGAMVFHMLRQVIGDEAFFRLLQTYSQRFAGRGATIDDFERLAEEVSGQPLDYFFGQWVRSTGVPQFEMDYIIKRVSNPEGFRVDGKIQQDLEIFRMPVSIRVETEGPPVTKTIEVTGTSTDFSIETFGKPLTSKIEIDPDFNVLKYTPDLRLRVAIARGESLFQRGRYFEATREYQRALEVKRNSSLAHYRMGEAFFEQRNYQAAANAFREAINGDQEPAWTQVWSRLFLGKIFDLTGQRERAINEYRRALETNDDTQGALAEARKYLSEPYRRETRTIERIEQIERR